MDDLIFAITTFEDMVVLSFDEFLRRCFKLSTVKGRSISVKASLLLLLHLKEKMFFIDRVHSLIKGVLIQSCPAGAKNFINYVFCHPQFSGVIQNIENHCSIKAKFSKKN